MVDNDYDVILEEERVINFKINGVVYHIKKMSLIDYRDMAEIIGSVFMKGHAKIKSLKDGESNTEDLLSVIKILDEKDIIKLLKLFLHTEDTEVCTRLINHPEVIIDIVKSVCTLNNFEVLLKKGKEALGVMKAKGTETNPLMSS